MGESASVSTCSTHGFTTFDELCRGEVKGYSLNLVDLRKYKSTRERIDALIDKVKETNSLLGSHSKKKIQHFYIGKTYAEGKAGKTFNPNDVKTWREKGISYRWRSTYKRQGYDGLVVLGAVSSGMLKDDCNKDIWNQQLYVLALENALITHFAYEYCDRRLANDSLQPGLLQQTLSAGYVVCIAFKYKEQEETDESNSSSDHELNVSNLFDSNLNRN